MESVDKRVTQLHSVFRHAVTESCNDMDSTTLHDCCTSIKAPSSVNHIEEVFEKVMCKTQVSMDEAFSHLCELNRVESVIRNAMVTGDASGDGLYDASGNDVGQEFGEIIHIEKQNEKERLSIAIAQLDHDVKRQRELLSRLKAQVQNEIAAATEECQKMSLAAAQIGKSQQ